MPYQQPGQPQQGYQPYYPPPQPNNKGGGMKFGVLIAIIAAAVVLLSIISVLLVQNKKIEDAKTVQSIQNATLMDYSSYKGMESERNLVVDGVCEHRRKERGGINGRSFY